MNRFKGYRKFLVAVFGLGHAMIVWTASFVCGIKWPEVFPNIINLSVPIVTFVSLVTMALIGGQSAIDYKAAQQPQQPPQQ
jgi:hypothetical protein